MLTTMSEMYRAKRLSLSVLPTHLDYFYHDILKLITTV